jgi:hypothetical protein
MTIPSLSTAVTGHKRPTVADIDQRRHELLPEAAFLSHHQTSPASHDPVSPFRPEPQPEPQPPLRQEPAPQPQHSSHPIFEQYALYGLAGEAVRTLAPHTEAQPEAILLQLLAAFGNVIGPGPHCMVGATRHTLDLFVVLVGESSKGSQGNQLEPDRQPLRRSGSPLD